MVEVRAKPVVVLGKQTRSEGRGFPQKPKKGFPNILRRLLGADEVGKHEGSSLSLSLSLFLSLSTTLVLSLTTKVERISSACPTVGICLTQESTSRSPTLQ